MAKEKLFTPKDFDKEPKSPKTDPTKWIIGAVVIIATVLVTIFAIKGCNSNNEPNSSEATTDISAIVNDTNVDSGSVEEITIIDENVSHTSDNTMSQNKDVESLQDTTVSTEPTVAQSNHAPSADVESEALKVIRGDYGNYPERKNALGDKYESIQNRVNQLKRQGVF